MLKLKRIVGGALLVEVFHGGLGSNHYVKIMFVYLEVTQGFVGQIGLLLQKCWLSVHFDSMQTSVLKI